MLGAYEKSIRLFEQALDADPGDHMAVYNIGLAHLRIGDTATALTHFEKASQKNGDVYEIAFQIGKLLLDEGHADRAAGHLRKAAALNPDSGLAHKYLGRCLEAAGEFEKAIHAYKLAVKHNPNDAESLSALGYLFDKTGENPVITTIFCQQSVDIEPDNGLYRQRLGELHLKQNQLTEALEAFREADRLGHASTEMIESVLVRMENENENA
jgi:tetratricopeptide (TPR) repeat protein